MRAPKCDSNRDEAKSTESDISVSPSPFAKNTLAYLTAAFRVVGRCVTITQTVQLGNKRPLSHIFKAR